MIRPNIAFVCLLRDLKHGLLLFMSEESLAEGQVLWLLHWHSTTISLWALTDDYRMYRAERTISSRIVAIHGTSTFLDRNPNQSEIHVDALKFFQAKKHRCSMAAVSVRSAIDLGTRFILVFEISYYELYFCLFQFLLWIFQSSPMGLGFLIGQHFSSVSTASLVRACSVSSRIIALNNASISTSCTWSKLPCRNNVMRTRLLLICTKDEVVLSL